MWQSLFMEPVTIAPCSMSTTSRQRCRLPESGGKLVSQRRSITFGWRFALLNVCHAVTIYGSTTWIEAATAGKNVIVADRYLYHSLPWAQSAESPAPFVELLDRVPWSARRPLVRHPGLDYARITYQTDISESLEHGKDQGLDRITDVILDRRPVYDPIKCVDAAVEWAAIPTHLEAARLKMRTTK